MLVVMPRDIDGHMNETDSRAETVCTVLQRLGSNRRVRLHDLPFFGVQASGLEKNLIWQAYVADVMQGCATFDCLDKLLIDQV